MSASKECGIAGEIVDRFVEGFPDNWKILMSKACKAYETEKQNCAKLDSGAGGEGGGGEGNESKKDGNGKSSEGAEKNGVPQKQGAQSGEKRVRPKPGGGLNAVQSDATKNEVFYGAFLF